MTIKDLKKSIEEKSFSDNLLIFVAEKDSFLVHQYIKKISEIKNLQISYVDNIKNTGDSLFSESPDFLYIFEVEELKLSENLPSLKNFIIVCEKISEETLSLVKDIVIDFPKLEEWQMKDYVYSRGKGVNTKYLDWLFCICNKNIYRLDKELDKLDLFEEAHRNFIFENFIKDGVYEDLSNFQIYDLTNAIQIKDFDKISSILADIENIDVEPTGLLTLLYGGFKKIINVWLDKNPTPESTGLKSNQIYAIKNLPRNYTKEQLINVFEFLTTVDFKLKNGYIDANNLIDYIIIKVLSM